MLIVKDCFGNAFKCPLGASPPIPHIKLYNFGCFSKIKPIHFGMDVCPIRIVFGA